MPLLYLLHAPLSVIAHEIGAFWQPLVADVEHTRSYDSWQVLGPIPLFELVFIHLLPGGRLDTVFPLE